MKTRLYAVFAFLIGLAATSCINPDETQEVIFQRDLEAIQKYLEENPIEADKKYEEPVEGVYVYWLESTSPDLGNILRLDTVRVNYTGRLLNGDVFDSSIEQVARDNGVYDPQRNYQPLRLTLGTGFGAIAGFEFSVSLMRPTEKIVTIFPSRLGYGSQGQGPVPPNSPMIFEIELLDVKNGPNHN